MDRKHVVIDTADAARIQQAKQDYFDKHGIWLSTRAIVKIILDRAERV